MGGLIFRGMSKMEKAATWVLSVLFVVLVGMSVFRVTEVYGGRSDEAGKTAGTASR